jgi:hypothetical protein
MQNSPTRIFYPRKTQKAQKAQKAQKNNYADGYIKQAYSNYCQAAFLKTTGLCF